VVATTLNNDDTTAHSHVRGLSEPSGGACQVARRGRSTLLTFGTVPYPRQQARTTGRSAATIRAMVGVVFAFQSCSPLEHICSTLYPSRFRGSETGIRGLSYLVLRSQSLFSEVCMDVLAAQYASTAARYPSYSSGCTDAWTGESIISASAALTAAIQYHSGRVSTGTSLP
jgi:hypothetical protein